MIFLVTIDTVISFIRLLIDFLTIRKYRKKGKIRSCEHVEMQYKRLEPFFLIYQTTTTKNKKDNLQIGFRLSLHMFEFKGITTHKTR